MRRHNKQDTYKYQSFWLHVGPPRCRLFGEAFVGRSLPLFLNNRSKKQRQTNLKEELHQAVAQISLTQIGCDLWAPCDDLNNDELKEEKI